MSKAVSNGDAERSGVRGVKAKETDRLGDANIPFAGTEAGVIARLLRLQVHRRLSSSSFCFIPFPPLVLHPLPSTLKSSDAGSLKTRPDEETLKRGLLVWYMNRQRGGHANTHPNVRVNIQSISGRLGLSDAPQQMDRLLKLASLMGREHSLILSMLTPEEKTTLNELLARILRHIAQKEDVQAVFPSLTELSLSDLSSLSKAMEDDLGKAEEREEEDEENRLPSGLPVHVAALLIGVLLVLADIFEIAQWNSPIEQTGGELDTTMKEAAVGAILEAVLRRMYAKERWIQGNSSEVPKHDEASEYGEATKSTIVRPYAAPVHLLAGMLEGKAGAAGKAGGPEENEGTGDVSGTFKDAAFLALEQRGSFRGLFPNTASRPQHAPASTVLRSLLHIDEGNASGFVFAVNDIFAVVLRGAALRIAFASGFAIPVYAAGSYERFVTFLPIVRRECAGSNEYVSSKGKDEEGERAVQYRFGIDLSAFGQEQLPSGGLSGRSTLLIPESKVETAWRRVVVHQEASRGGTPHKGTPPTSPTPLDTATPLSIAYSLAQVWAWHSPSKRDTIAKLAGQVTEKRRTKEDKDDGGATPSSSSSPPTSPSVPNAKPGMRSVEIERLFACSSRWVETMAERDVAQWKRLGKAQTRSYLTAADHALNETLTAGEGNTAKHKRKATFIPSVVIATEVLRTMLETMRVVHVFPVPPHSLAPQSFVTPPFIAPSPRPLASRFVTHGLYAIGNFSLDFPSAASVPDDPFYVVSRSVAPVARLALYLSVRGWEECLFPRPAPAPNERTSSSLSSPSSVRARILLPRRALWKTVNVHYAQGKKSSATSSAFQGRAVVGNAVTDTATVQVMRDTWKLRLISPVQADSSSTSPQAVSSQVTPPSAPATVEAPEPNGGRNELYGLRGLHSGIPSSFPPARLPGRLTREREVRRGNGVRKERVLRSELPPSEQRPGLEDAREGKVSPNRHFILVYELQGSDDAQDDARKKKGHKSSAHLSAHLVFVLRENDEDGTGDSDMEIVVRGQILLVALVRSVPAASSSTSPRCTQGERSYEILYAHDLSGGVSATATSAGKALSTGEAPSTRGAFPYIYILDGLGVEDWLALASLHLARSK